MPSSGVVSPRRALSSSAALEGRASPSDPSRNLSAQYPRVSATVRRNDLTRDECHAKGSDMAPACSRQALEARRGPEAGVDGTSARVRRGNGVMVPAPLLGGMTSRSGAVERTSAVDDQRQRRSSRTIRCLAAAPRHNGAVPAGRCVAAATGERSSPLMRQRRLPSGGGSAVGCADRLDSPTRNVRRPGSVQQPPWKSGVVITVAG